MERYQLIIWIINKVIGEITKIKLKFNKSILIKGKLKIKGQAIIATKNGGSIEIGNNVTLNSSNYGYHINMFAPVKLYADRKNASIRIGNNTRIHGTCIHAYQNIIIGNNVLIAANCNIIDGNGHDLSFDNPSNRINTIGGSKSVIINDNVWIGANSLILPGVTIGEGSVIAAGSIVTKDIPPMVVAGGNPAKVIKKVISENMVS
jgi:acetyltransferase-like isoleucine patch superfamily enzyme